MRKLYFKHDDYIYFIMSHHADINWDAKRRAIFLYEGRGGQVSHISGFLGQFSATGILSNVVHLRLEGYPKVGRPLETDGVEWLRLLRQFSAVQTLHVSHGLAGYVALALEDTTGDSEVVTEVLQSLNLICLAGQSASSVERFIASRALSDRPVTVVDTIREFSERLKSSVSN